MYETNKKIRKRLRPVFNTASLKQIRPLPGVCSQDTTVRSDSSRLPEPF